MPTYAQGMSEKLALGFESTAGTMPGSAVAYAVPVINPQVTPSRNKFQSQALSGSPQPRPVRFGKTGVDGSFRLECSKDSLPIAYKGLFGTPTDSGVAGWYDHRFSLGTMIPTFVEQQHSDVTQFLLSNGVFVGSHTINTSAEGIREADFGIMGMSQAIAGSTGITTLNDRTTAQPFDYLYIVVKQGGTILGYSQECSVTINRNLGKAMAQDQTNKVASIFSQIAAVSGTMKVLFQDASLYGIAAAGTETSVDIFIPAGAGHGVYYQMPSVIFEPMSVTTNGTGLVTGDLKFDAQGGRAGVAGEMRSKWFTSVSVGAGTSDSFVWKSDGGSDQTITLTSGSRTIQQLQTQLSGALTGVTVSIEQMTGETGGRLKFVSNTSGATSSVQLKNTSTCSTLLGMDNTLHAGLDGQSIVATVMNAQATL